MAETKQWILDGTGSTDNLRLVTVTEPASLGPNDVLVDLKAAALNFRDIVILKAAIPNITSPKPNLVPLSDGAGTVRRVGPAVTTFRPGDNVVLHMLRDKDEDFLPAIPDINAGMGQAHDGTLRQSGVFHESDLLPMPANGMSFAQAATLGCSGLTAWNALMGLSGRKAKKGDWVLVQGTGGVSVAALQFAVALGAHVVATTSTDAKAARLRSLGAAHVLNYRANPSWGDASRALTPGQRGFHHVVDVGGNATLPESMKSVRVDGVVVVAGVLGGFDAKAEGASTLQSVMVPKPFVMRGVLLGSKRMYREMIEFCDEKDVRPAVDDYEEARFGLKDAKCAYERLEEQNHFSKVVIQLE